jgi:ankyrin repeat protein
MNENDFMEFINQKDSKGYTLLMLATSNNLIQTVKQLIISGADTTPTI